MGGAQRQDEALAILELVGIKGAQAIAGRLRRKLEVAVAVAGAEGEFERFDGLIIEARAEGEIAIVIIDR